MPIGAYLADQHQAGAEATEDEDTPRPRRPAIALDGKALKGSARLGQRCRHLLSAVTHHRPSPSLRPRWAPRPPVRSGIHPNERCRSSGSVTNPTLQELERALTGPGQVLVHDRVGEFVQRVRLVLGSTLVYAAIAFSLVVFTHTIVRGCPSVCTANDQIGEVAHYQALRG